MTNFACCRRNKNFLALVSFALAWCCLPSGTALATGPYVRIEQDWEVDLATVNSSLPAPQISLLLEPFPNSPKGGIVLLNYVDSPSFAAGGIQLQLWNGTTAAALQTQKAGLVMPSTINSQKLTFTMFQDLNVIPGNLTFGISKGNFLAPWCGPVPPLGWVISMPYTDLTTFTGYYQTSDSVAGSGLMVGSSQNVTAIKINAVRKYDATGHFDSETAVQVFP